VRLKLSNIGQHEAAEFEIPDNGLVALKGISGAGKTTIFSAIFEAIYGTEDDIVTWGKTSCMVQLEYRTIQITRTRGPRTLTVALDAREYKDDEAQEKINEWIGAGEFEFLLCSYVRQQMEGSLLSSTPSEQLRIVQQLSVGQCDPEKIKARIAEKIKNAETSHNALAALIDSATAQSRILKENADQWLSAKARVQKNITENSDLVDVAEQVSKENSELSDLNKLIEKINRSLNDQALKDVESAQSDIAALLAVNADLTAQIQNLTARAGDEVLEDLSDKISELAEIRRVAHDKRTYLDSLKSQPKCPHCSGRLIIKNGTIEAGGSLSDDQVANIASELTDLTAAVTLKERYIKSADMKKNERANLLRSAAELQIKIDANLKKINQKIELQESFKASGRKTRQELEAIKDQTLAKISVKNNSLRELTQQNEAFKSLQRAKAELDKINATITDIEAKIAANQVSISDLDAKRQSATSKIANLKRFKDINDKAAVESVEGVLGSINAIAAEYLNRFFPNDGTSITLNNTFVTKKGDERSKMSMEAFHKGKVVKKLKSLSGGEKSRAFLSFQLALADMYKTNILMIDEGLSGADLETKEVCLVVLKELSNDRLILVIEHGVSDHFFDTVINVG
jgi:DNA repair exonuclease SbcCD ATPase subunit